MVVPTQNTSPPSEDGFLAGTPCWVEVSTPRPEATQRFYADLFGWEYHRTVGPTGVSHTIAMLDAEPVAGIHHQPNQPSSWNLYLATRDLNAACERVRHFGGHDLGPARDVPGLGRTMMMTDPSSGVTGFCQPHPTWQFTLGVPGSLVWAEFHTNHPRVADRLFGSLFGYQPRQVGTGSHAEYVVWFLGEDAVLARLPMGYHAPVEAAPYWMLLFHVNPTVGTDGTLQQAVRMGGRVRVKPFETPYGRVAVLNDVTGACFAVVDPLDPEEDDGAAIDDPYDD